MVNLPGLPNELTYYYPAWQADPGVDYQLDSVQTLLVRGGSRFYDQATGRPYNPADPAFGPGGYTLTAPDGSRDVIGGGGVVEHIDADGGVLHVSDSGIAADNGDTLRLVRDTQGRLLAAQAPDGQTINYVYNAQGELSSVVHSSLGTLYRYGYDPVEQTLDVALLGDVTGTSYSNAQATGLTDYFGSPSEFDGQPISQSMPAGGQHDYALTVSDAEISGTNAGTVILRVVVQKGFGFFVPATPDLVGLEPLSRYVDGKRTVALFEIAHGGTYLLRIRGASASDTGQYSLRVDVVGDVNLDGRVDGIDSQLLDNRVGTNFSVPGYTSAADLDANYSIDVADRQLLAHNYGFVADSSAPTFPDYFAAASGTVWTPGTGDGSSTSSDDGSSQTSDASPTSEPGLQPRQTSSAGGANP